MEAVKSIIPTEAEAREAFYAAGIEKGWLRRRPDGVLASESDPVLASLLRIEQLLKEAAADRRVARECERVKYRD